MNLERMSYLWQNIIKNKMVKSTILIMIATMLAYVLGFFVQVMIAAQFGASKYVDSFVVAYVIPDIFYAFTNAILVTGFILVFTNYRVKYGEEKACSLLANIFNISFMFLIIISLVINLTSPWVSRIIAPGFNLEETRITSIHIRLLSFAIIFLGLSSLTTGFLYAQKHFFIPALLKSIISLMTIISIYLFIDRFHIFCLPIGIIIGTFFAFFIQLIIAFRKGFKWARVINLKDPGLKKIINLSTPLIFASTFFYLNRYVDKIIASTLPEGRISILNYAFLLFSFPAIFSGASISTVIFPSLSQYVAEGKLPEVKRLFLSSIKIIAGLLFPITIFLIIFSKPLVKLVFQRGRFDAEATNATGIALSLYAIGLVAYGLYPVILRVYHALGETKMIAFLSFCLLFSNTSFNLILVRYFSYRGLAIATSMSYIGITLIAYHILKKKLRKPLKDI